ncbi:MAG: hypothetical protein JJU06_01895 [Ectothiorhodospiraceae bacterium]|nr:hypothetical protein [Ectothiorhodospiraceae bacterium]MCH8503583.1 hypothetical protein [Ectothiorhodospiraceae bacterium]
MTETGHAGPTASAATLPPLAVMLIAFVLALAVIAMVTTAATQTRWMGAEFRAAEQGWLEVTQVLPDSPAYGRLTPGVRLGAVVGEGGTWVSLIGYDPHLDPHNLPTFAGYRDYLSRSDSIARVLADGRLTLVTETGERIPIVLAKDRPLHSLPAGFWMLNLFGLGPLLIGLAVWVFRPRQAAARLLALSGAGFFIATCAHSVYISRELALPVQPFELLLRVNHLGLTLLLGALLALLAYYPRRLTHYPAGLIVLVLMLVYQVNENLQWLSWPGHAFYSPLLALYVLGMLVAYRQWQLAQQQPLDRAALKWVFLSVFLSMGFSLALYFAPMAVGEAPLLSAPVMVGVASTVYVGFALGVLRYRLFDLERWWFTAWMWFFGGVAVLLVDAALVLALGLQPIQALGIAVIAVGWIYFPIRQWLWRLISRQPQAAIEGHLARLTSAMLGATSPEASTQRWREFLAELYRPLNIVRRPVNQATGVGQNGGVLHAPMPEQEGHLELMYAHNGQSLFTPQDADMVDALLAVARQICQTRNAEAAGARTERRRIMRDLHDDVGGHLLTLLHGTGDARTRDQARAALQALRESIHALDEGRAHHLEDALEDWHAELRERCAQSSSELRWDYGVAMPDTFLSARQYINIKRILGEAVSNAIRHARPEELRVQVHAGARQLGFSVRNSLPGGVSGSSHPLAGRGLNNMRTRAEEIGGALRISPPDADSAEFVVELRVPLDAARR